MNKKLMYLRRMGMKYFFQGFILYVRRKSRDWWVLMYSTDFDNILSVKNMELSVKIKSRDCPGISLHSSMKAGPLF